MARSKKNARTKAKPAKASRRAAPEPQAEVLEEVDSGGMGIDEGMIFTTFLLLAGAVYMVWSLTQARFPDPIVY